MNFAQTAAAALVEEPPTLKSGLHRSIKNTADLLRASREDKNSFARSELEETLRASRAFEPGWDGHGGIAPAPEAVRDALAALREIPTHLEAPQPLISGDGEAGFYWRRGEAYIEAGFYGDGKMNYFARDENRKVLCCVEDAEMSAVGARPPSEFLNAVEALFPDVR